MFVRILLFSLVVVALTLGSFYWYHTTKNQVWWPNSIDKVVFYSIDGRGTKEVNEKEYEKYFHKFPVVGEVELTGEDRSSLLTALNQGIAEGFAKASCFWPRHGIRIERAGQTTDYVICFYCKFMEVHNSDGRKIVMTSDRPKAVFNQLLSKYELPLVPE